MNSIQLPYMDAARARVSQCLSFVNSTLSGVRSFETSSNEYFQQGFDRPWSGRSFAFAPAALRLMVDTLSRSSLLKIMESIYPHPPMC